MPVHLRPGTTVPTSRCIVLSGFLLPYASTCSTPRKEIPRRSEYILKRQITTNITLRKDNNTKSSTHRQWITGLKMKFSFCRCIVIRWNVVNSFSSTFYLWWVIRQLIFYMQHIQKLTNKMEYRNCCVSISVIRSVWYDPLYQTDTGVGLE